MHYQFSKLYLGHHAFRGLKDQPIPMHFLSAATSGYDAAITIFRMILSNSALRENLLGIPHYFHIMISFAGHFLLDVCMRYPEQLSISVEKDLECVRLALAHLARLETLPQHAISRSATGLFRKLSECSATYGLDSALDQSPFVQMRQGASQKDAAPASAAYLADAREPYDSHNGFTAFEDLNFDMFDDLTFDDQLQFQSFT